MSNKQSIENLMLVHFIRSSHVFEDSDDESDDSEKEFEAEEAEENELIFLGLSFLLDSCYLESRIYNIAKSQEWWHLIIPKYDDLRFKKIMRMDSQSFQNLILKIESHSIF